jgi:hypothetical protein
MTADPLPAGDPVVVSLPAFGPSELHAGTTSASASTAATTIDLLLAITLP